MPQSLSNRYRYQLRTSEHAHLLESFCNMFIVGQQPLGKGLKSHEFMVRASRGIFEAILREKLQWKREETDSIEVVLKNDAESCCYSWVLQYLLGRYSRFQHKTGLVRFI